MSTSTDVTQDVNAVYASELTYIVARRQALKDAGVDAAGLAAELRHGPDTIAPKVAHDLVGLALSGGGIRSATFSLGVLQALAKLDALKYVDYLSTVSGGGYIGSRNVSTTLRHRRHAFTVELRPSREERSFWRPGGSVSAPRRAPAG